MQGATEDAMGKVRDVLKSWNVFSQITMLKKELTSYRMGPGNLRPDQPKHIKDFIPRFPYPKEALFDLAVNSDVATAIHIALRREIFRNGFDILESKNTDEETTISTQTMLPQDPGTPKKEVLKFLEDCNLNGQDILEVLGECEDDLSVYDDFFILLNNTYDYGVDGDISDWKLQEVVRIDPRVITMVLNSQEKPGYDEYDKPQRVCPEHRDRVSKDETCHCGLKCHLAHYMAEYNGKKIFYFKNEIIHKSKYRPSKRHGYPPMMTVWQKLRTLLFQDKYIMELYDGQRPPKAGLFFKTPNQDGMKKAWDQAMANAREHPHLPIMMSIPDSTNGKGFVEFIDFMKGLDEMQYTEARKDMARMIGAVYGVEPIFQGDMSTSGGLNNEGLQITVTNRAIEYGQKLYNKYVFPKILKMMKVEGWIIELQPSEEQDEMAKLERQGKTLQNGQLALQLGLQAEYDPDSGEVVIREGQLQDQNAMNAMVPQFGQPDMGNMVPQDAPPEADPSGTPDVSKASQPTKLSKALKEEIRKLLKSGKKLDKVSLDKILKDLKNKLDPEFQGHLKEYFEQTYKTELVKVGKELGMKIAFGEMDKNAISLLLGSNALSEAISSLQGDLAYKVRTILFDAYTKPEGLTEALIAERIKEVTDLADFRVNTIARTELSKVASAARLNSYRRESDFNEAKFKHIGPDDDRTTPTSKRIKKRTATGVPWETYVQIVTEESARDFPDWQVNPEAPVSHYNSRHVFVRV